MKILVINAGSSSLKYQLIDMETETVLAKGICDRIGDPKAFIKYQRSGGESKKTEVRMENHVDAFRKVTEVLADPADGAVRSLSEISAIGHRIVQGGALFSKSVLVNDKTIEGIRSLIPLAPLHNKPELEAILASQQVFGKELPQCAVFDTAFHSTMPEKAYLYAIPYKYYEQYHIRRYGFHGTSHRYVSKHCAHLMGKPLESLKMITCHIGNGSSIAAIQDGRVIDTSMGLTPLDGFIMGTRSGQLDPSIVTFLMEKENLTPQQMNDILNKESGVYGVSGIKDDRDIEKAEAEGDKRAILAHEIQCYQIAKFIGAYAAALNGLDCLVFTAGLGENSPIIRRGACKYLSYLGVELDPELNEKFVHGKEGKISAEDSKVPVYVINTNEELVIARDTAEIVGRLAYANTPDRTDLVPEDV